MGPLSGNNLGTADSINLEFLQSEGELYISGVKCWEQMWMRLNLWDDVTKSALLTARSHANALKIEGKTHEKN